MNAPASRLSPLFRSDTQADLLARLLLNPDRACTIAELARSAGAAYATAHREVQRLIDAGVLTQERVGQSVRVQAQTSDAAYAPLVELLRMSHGPTAMLPAILAGVPGLREAYIYGSWAARRTGERGSPPGDIDVLLVGSVARARAYEAGAEAERQLGREVGVRVVSSEAWADGDDPFLRTVRGRPLIRLALEGDAS